MSGDESPRQASRAKLGVGWRGAGVAAAAGQGRVTAPRAFEQEETEEDTCRVAGGGLSRKASPARPGSAGGGGGCGLRGGQSIRRAGAGGASRARAAEGHRWVRMEPSIDVQSWKSRHGGTRGGTGGGGDRPAAHKCATERRESRRARLVSARLRRQPRCAGPTFRRPTPWRPLCTGRARQSRARPRRAWPQSGFGLRAWRQSRA